MTDSTSRRVSLDRPLTGVAIPVSSLRSTDSVGIGEFSDLIPMGEWCVEAGLQMMQILPINDTGTLSSPYSAVSAFALNPAYIRLSDVAGTEGFSDEIQSFAEAANETLGVEYERVLGFKLDILFRAYVIDRDASTAALDHWIGDNPWVRTYSVYKCLKDRYDQKSWVEWPEHRDPSAADLDALWAELEEFTRFYAWVQMHLDQQLQRAKRSLGDQGLFLKGDIPILMNVDSADVWAHRQYFDLDHGAGAPPDMFTRTGQTWGFPIYRWDALERDDYRWWRDRMGLADRYYDAFRIDHVIGFFRIWSQANHERTAILGHYEPSPHLSPAELRAAGLEEQDVVLLTSGWTTPQEAEAAIGVKSTHVLKTYFDASEIQNVNNGDSTHLLRDEFASEIAIESLDEPEDVLDFLTDVHRDRAFVSTNGDGFVPTWYWDEAKALDLLGSSSLSAFRRIVDDYRAAAAPSWMALGRKNLTMLAGTTEMLACAEDLGAVPEGLRDVLADLGILSLKIERWEVADTGGLLDPSEFPRLSVSTPSVHDLATLRVWWEEDDDRQAYFDDLGLDGACPSFLTMDVAEAAVRRNLSSNSAIVVFQIQDLFSLTYDLRTEHPSDERINVPGTVGDHNWTYRIPVPIERLRSHELGSRVRDLISAERSDWPTAKSG